MATMVMLKGFLGSGILLALENKFLKDLLPALYQKTIFGLPKAYGLVVLVNVLGSVFRLLQLGFAVGAARSKFGAGFEYPKMYHEGDSKEAKQFNCIQRGHQQALETYPQYLVMSLFSGAVAPVGTAAAGLMWSISRKVWADGYATGDPNNRYSSSVSKFIWWSLLYVMTGTAAAGAKIADLY